MAAITMNISQSELQKFPFKNDNGSHYQIVL